MKGNDRRRRKKRCRQLVRTGRESVLSGHNQEAVGAALQRAVPFQQALGLHQAGEAFLHRETLKLPFADAGKPNQRAYVKVTDGAEGFVRAQDGKTCPAEAFCLLLSPVAGEGQRKTGQQQLREFPVVELPHLLGDEQPAGLQDPPDLGWIIGFVAVDHQIEGLVRQRQGGIVRHRCDGESQRLQLLPAQKHVGRIGFGHGGERGRMPQRQ